MRNILIATYPFGLCGDLPCQLLEEEGYSVKYNSLGRRLKENEVKRMLKNIDAVIAGTEPYNEETIKYANTLKVISRVGVGLDSIDYKVCLKKNIKVAYTPEAPADSVADLTVAQIFNLLRSIHISDKFVKEGRWKRILGESVQNINIGILGVGRIGSRVINRLKNFGANILACDINPNNNIEGIKWVDKETLFENSDLISIHIPLTKKNYHFIGLDELSSMKEGSYLINTSRGAVINEKDLESCVLNNHLAGVALDVFEKEPYDGVMKELDNVILSAHIGASDKRSRYLMELGAVENCIEILNGKIPKNIVTEKNFE